jgi:SagB-type dehydrogenase family enzyme
MVSSLFSSESNPGLLLHEWTKNVRDGRVPARPEPAGQQRRERSWAERLFARALPSEDFAPAQERPADARQTTLQTFANRQSVRRYSKEPLTREQVAQLLSLCFPDGRGRPIHTEAAAPHELQTGAPANTACKLFPLVSNVTELAGGGYFYDERRRQLKRIRQEPTSSALQEFCFQAEFLHAPVLLLVVGSLAESLALHGDRGYRIMMVEAGAMLQRLYMAASHLNLAGCATGSIVQERLGAWLGLDGYEATVLMGFAVGLPRAEEN